MTGWIDAPVGMKASLVMGGYTGLIMLAGLIAAAIQFSGGSDTWLSVSLFVLPFIGLTLAFGLMRAAIGVTDTTDVQWGPNYE